MCKRCGKSGKTYSKLKAWQSSIICKLLEDYEGALEAYTNPRESPFIYYANMRNECMEKHLVLEELAANKKRYNRL